MSDLIYQTVTSLAGLIRDKQVSPTELLEAHLRRIEQVNPQLNAITHLDAEGARRQAAAADQTLARGEEIGPLHGLPMTMKSCIDVAGFPCECGSRLRQGYRAERDATLVSRLKRAGAIIVGNTNVPDMLMAYETDNYLYGRTNSPWDLARTPGGSSGGEAAAIASGCSAAGFGSDGGGSVRVPAHFCGIFGLKPTAGLIPRTGHWPDCVGPGALMGLVGPMARSAGDLELLLQVTAGEDDQDPSSVPLAVETCPDRTLRQMKIGWYEDDGMCRASAETRAAVRQAAGALEGQGFTVEPFELKGMDATRQHWWMLFGVTGAALTKPLIEGRESDVHPLVRGLLAPEEAARASFDDLLHTWVERDRLRGELLQQMQQHRVLLCPVAAVPAFRHGEREWTVDCKTVRYPKIFSYCQIFNLLGNPSVVVPVGRSPEGLPIGVQIVGRHFEDAVILGVARKLEQAIGGWQAPPEAAMRA